MPFRILKDKKYYSKKAYLFYEVNQCYFEEITVD